MDQKYTDVDYVVFSDGAREVWQGRSPYSRATYRYTPLLCERPAHFASTARFAPATFATLHRAWCMIPNVIGMPVFGKLVFVAVDMLIGHLIRLILAARGVADDTITFASALYLLNPLILNVATRGSADGLVVVLVLATVYTLMSRRVTLSALLFGLAVHVKIYPIVYALPLVLAMDASFAPADFADLALPAPQASGLLGQSAATLAWLRRLWSRPQAWVLDGPAVQAKQTPPQRRSQGWGLWQWPDVALSRTLALFTPRRVMYGVLSGGLFLALTAAFYLLYGWEFLYESLLHHLVRADNRHNFSLYFYDLYLKYDLPAARTGAGLAAFLPQFGTLAALGAMYARDLPFALFLQTLVFVAFNKVCTAQYFMWWMALLPLIAPASSMGWPTAILTGLLWAATELSWIATAFQLEWLGRAVFAEVWLVSAAFFLANVALLLVVLRNVTPSPLFQAGKLAKAKMQ